MLFSMRSNLTPNIAYTYRSGLVDWYTIIGDEAVLWQWMQDCGFDRAFMRDFIRDVKADDFAGYSYEHPDGRWVEVYPFIVVDTATEATIEAAFAPAEQLTLEDALVDDFETWRKSYAAYREALAEGGTFNHLTPKAPAPIDPAAAAAMKRHNRAKKAGWGKRVVSWLL